MAENRRIEGPKMSIQNAAESSRLITETRTSRRALGKFWRSSRTNRFASRVQAAFVAPVTRWVGRTTSHSFLYRWLTKEPEPEVIVVDLRDTVTVGPITALIDHLITATSPIAHSFDRAWQSSNLYRAGDWGTKLVDAAIRSRTGKLLVTLVEPSELPEDQDRQ